MNPIPEIPRGTGHRIAVIGAGVAGLTASYLLNRRHQVTLFEKNPYAGGHTNTVVIESGPDAGTAVDTGFIVFNDRNYPTFLRLLRELGINGQPSDMSFGFSSKERKFTYSSYVPNGLLAQRVNLVRPVFYRMLADILRFNKQARRDLGAGRLEAQTLGEYLDRGRYSRSFREFYLIPMGAAIWSTPLEEMLDFPSEVFVRFFENHGLLELKGRPAWMTVPGGSHTYVKAMLKAFRGRVELKGEIGAVKRTKESVLVRKKDGSETAFDYAIIATHANEALRMLEDPSEDEIRLLGAWSYTRNKTVLHTDESIMPSNKRAWASWNCTAEGGGLRGRPVSLTYHMNRLQNLKTERHYFVTLNALRSPARSEIIAEIEYTHPCYTRRSIATQTGLPFLNGVRRTHYCGSYFGYGFHEDAVRSAADLAREHFGIGL